MQMSAFKEQRKRHLGLPRTLSAHELNATLLKLIFLTNENSGQGS